MKEQRKVRKMGNSLSVNMTELLKRIGADQGDLLDLEIVEDEEIRIKKHKDIQLPEGISEDFFDVLRETVAEYDHTLRKLKDR